jgi:hypothetical protein
MPMIDFTLNDLLKFTLKEAEMVKEILPEIEKTSWEPSESSINNILAYSKVLSVRKSKNLNHISIVLN